ncbi:MAG: peptidylprolyl isomerase [Chloroflexi bacterium]|nr:peptidylprolyl isomerase [Chloroflexota bacterium]
MAQAKEGDTVKVHYTGRLDDGSVFDTSAKGDPLQFTIGMRQMIPGFEEAVVGMNPGDSRAVTIPPDKAYGSHHAQMVLEADRKEFPEHVNLQIGRTIRIGQQAGGPTLEFRVMALSEASVTLDANHPLAGKELTFDIHLIEIL